tara:strand:- start:82 stop:612 length:531 start_codon:yes stop_codon:yes gene_type:complete
MMNQKKAKLKQKKSKLDQNPSRNERRLRVIADNRKARFDFEIIDTIEAGVVLTGTEIKSIRAGRINIRDAYAQIRNEEMWLQNLHISSWSSGGRLNNHDPIRSRKLLMRRSQILDLATQSAQKGLTLVALKVYIKGHFAKVELALAKGRRRYDKRKVIMQRETDREIARAIRHRQF